MLMLACVLLAISVQAQPETELRNRQTGAAGTGLMSKILAGFGSSEDDERPRPAGKSGKKAFKQD